MCRAIQSHTRAINLGPWTSAATMQGSGANRCDQLGERWWLSDAAWDGGEEEEKKRKIEGGCCPTGYTTPTDKGCKYDVYSGLDGGWGASVHRSYRFTATRSLPCPVGGLLLFQDNPRLSGLSLWVISFNVHSTTVARPSPGSHLTTYHRSLPCGITRVC